MAFELSPPERLGRTVVLGYCDIAAAGIRALGGLSAGTASEDASSASTPAGKGLRESGRESLRFSGMRGAVFNGLPAVDAVHFEADSESDDGESSPDTAVTLLNFNTEVGPGASASLAMAIVDLLSEKGSAVQKIVIAAAVQPPKRTQIRRSSRSSSTTKASAAAAIPPDCVCAFTSPSPKKNEAEKENNSVEAVAAGLTALPSSVRIADSFLTTLIRLCQLEELPLLVLARMGYRATGAKADVDGTDEAIRDLGVCLSKITRLRFDPEKAFQMTWSKGWKGKRPAQGVVPGYI